MEDEEACPHCGEQAVVFDHVQGLSVCESCGAVLEESNLVQHIEYEEEAGRIGVLVAADDTGERAAAFALSREGPGLAIQRSRRTDSQAKLKRRLREVASQLQLPPRSCEQALHLLEQAIPHCCQPGLHWRREHLVAASVYSACRLDHLPVTLVDLSGAMHIDPFTLGRSYQALLGILDLRPPCVTTSDLLPRAVDRALSAISRDGQVAAARSAALQRDSEFALGWMAQQLPNLCTVTTRVATALIMAGEMNDISLSSELMARMLSVGKRTLDTKLLEVKAELLRLAPLLPYGSTINKRNVLSHAKMIIRFSGIVAAATHGGAGALTGSTQGEPSSAGRAPEGGSSLASASVQLLEYQQKAKEAAADAVAEAGAGEQQAGYGAGGAAARAGRGPKRRKGQGEEQGEGEKQEEEEAEEGLSDLSDRELDQYIMPSRRRQRPRLGDQDPG